MRIQIRLLAVLVFLLAAPAPTYAWDAYGHRLITMLAIEGMGKDAEPWLTDKDCVAQVADQATVPDRWRSTHLNQLTHLNSPDHYLDVEDLDAYGLSLKTIPPLRYEYVKALALAKEKAGEHFHGRPVNPAHDMAKTEEIPGFVPYAILEQYGKLQSAFHTIRVLEKLNDPARANELEMAKENAKYNMGILSHFVGDAAQPLHATKHHHGWVGENSKGYTTDKGFHAFIDGTVLKIHDIDASTVRPACRFDVSVDAHDPWDNVISYFETTFQQVEPLYELEKTGELRQDKGKEFITQRLAAGASMLAALYRAAWESAAPSEKDVAEFIKYDNFEKAHSEGTK
jgi:hypothetical protein